MLDTVPPHHTDPEPRPRLTWQCDKCGAEFDYFTYGGPCPGDAGQGCDGELQRRKPSATIRTRSEDSLASN